jgi:Tol biopolymer transport system component
MTRARVPTAALLALLAGLALSASAPSRPGAAAPGFSLVFARDGEIYVRSVAGAVRRLTRDGASDSFPAWSPDRKRIVFSRATRGDADIYVMRANGTGLRRLAGSARGGQDLYPRFSPDGRSIVFASARGSREADVFVMRADGSGVRRIVAGPAWVEDTQPAFSPDGRHVVFASNRLSFFNYELYRVRTVGGGRATRLTFWGSGRDGAPGDDVSPSYSADGRRIAFVSDRRGGYAVWTMNARGGGLRELTRHPGQNVVFPRFSPDGRRLVYTAFPSRPGVAPVERIWTVRVDGSGRRSLGRGVSADW